MKKFCPHCKDETEVVFLKKGIDYNGPYEEYKCLNCQTHDRVYLGKESLRN